MKNSFFARILEKLNEKASYYQISPRVFIGLYFFSFVPFYLGIYLILLGLGIKVDSIIDLVAKRNFQINFSNSLIIWGALINRLAWALPYLYIQFFGRNLKWYYHALIWLWIGFSVINFILS